jgi:C1A family cysteine protease
MTAPTRRKVAGYGWSPDLPDARDHLYTAPHLALASAPPRMDLRNGLLPDVYDQGPIGSCTANAIAAAFQFDLRKENLADFLPSRLFIYYNERAMEGDTGFDSGAQLRDGIKSIANLGVCPENEWPYDATPAESEGGPFPPGARDGEKPGAECYQDALNSRATSYARLNHRDLDQLRGCLASGYPFVFGFTAYENLESAEVRQTGDIPMPGPEDRAIGGHAVLAVGYDDTRKAFLIRNSWGTDWGQKGYGTMPYAYLQEPLLSSDFWTVRVVT